MSMLYVHMLGIAILTSVTCTLPGVFIVLRGVSLMSDAISHAILFGIVVMFMLTSSLSSWVLMVGASLAGLLTVYSTEILIATHRVKKDAAIGLIFPFLFSVAVILISRGARNIHLDIDMVLLGELAFAPFHRLIMHSVDCGPHALWSMGFLLIINLLFIFFFYKELVLSVFDVTYMQVAGFKPLLIYYALMTLVSLTTVGAFDIVGSIVVVAMTITPAATALLWVRRMPYVLYAAVGISCITAFMGYCFAVVCDVSIAGSMALANGVLFVCVLLSGKKGGID